MRRALIWVAVGFGFTAPFGGGPFRGALFGSAPLANVAHAEDWPRWRGPRGDGTWQGPELAETWPQAGLAIGWKQAIGPGYSGVVVSEGRVIVTDRQKDPGEIERVLCFAAEDGRPLWDFDYPCLYGELSYGTGPRSAPTVAGGQVYCLGAMGHMVCLDAATGAVRWQVDGVKELAARLPEWGFAASPVIWGDLAIFHLAAQPGGCYVALDKTTGVERWRCGDDPAGYATPVVFPWAGADRLLGWTPENILAIDLASGQLLWKIPYKVTYGVSIATPVIQDDLVFVSGYWEGSKAIRLGGAPDQAEVVWEDNEALRALMSQPLVRGGHVYVLDKSRGLTCFELATGTKLWDDGHQATPRGRNPQASLVWTGDSDQALIFNSEGELLLVRLNPAGYTEQARKRITGPSWAHPAYAGSRVFARDDEWLVCAELPLTTPAPR